MQLRGHKAEPTDKVLLHKKNLVRSLQNHELIPLANLMRLENYPEPRQVGTFYAQSVMLVDYLSKLNEKYQKWINGYKLGKLLILDKDKLDFANSTDDMATEARSILRARLPARQGRY